MCVKVAYNTRNKAHIALRHILSKGKRLRIYKCPHCYKYHLTSQVNYYPELRPAPHT